MINKQQIKDEIEKVKDEDLFVIYRIIQALAKTPSFEFPRQSEKETDWVKFVNNMYGCLSDDPIQRGKQGDFETREIIE